MESPTERERTSALVASPSMLYFPPPLNQRLSKTLKLLNTAKHYVAFKVLTNRPNRYIVKPKNGIVPPSTSILIQIYFNPAKDQPTSLRCKDKFQIRSIALSSTPVQGTVDEIFEAVEPAQITLQKVRCKFESPPHHRLSGSALHHSSSSAPSGTLRSSLDGGEGSAAPKSKLSPGKRNTAGEEPLADTHPPVEAAPPRGSREREGEDAGTDDLPEELGGKYSSIVERLEGKAKEVERRLSKVSADLVDFEASIERFTRNGKEVVPKPPADTSFYVFSVVLAVLCAAVAYLLMQR